MSSNAKFINTPYGSFVSVDTIQKLELAYEENEWQIVIRSSAIGLPIVIKCGPEEKIAQAKMKEMAEQIGDITWIY